MSTAADATVSPTATPGQERHYGFSVLISGLARMWRATVPALVIIVLNAVVQAALVLGNPVTGASWVFWLLALASAVMLLVTGAVLSACALLAVTGRVGVGDALRHTRSNLGNYGLWAVLQALVVAIAYAFYTWPGAILWWVTAFVPIAAIDGQRNALAANFRAIASHPIRWLVTGLIIGVLGVIGWLLGAVNTFFIGGVVGSLAANLDGGLFAWWFLTAWACLYRSRRTEAAEPAAT